MMRKKSALLLFLAACFLLTACTGKGDGAVIIVDEEPPSSMQPETNPPDKPDGGEEPDDKAPADTKAPEESEPPVFCEEDFIITDSVEIAGLTEEILSGMTLEEKIGQLFFVNFELLDERKGSFHDFTKATATMRDSLLQYKPGGVIFFSRNIETVEQTQNFIVKLQKFSKIPLFTGVDEEGGDVARIAENPDMHTTAFPPMEEIGKTGDEDAAYTVGATIGREISGLGFNLDFAPVADVNTKKANTEIGNRSFGSDPKTVGRMVSQVVKGLADQNVVSVLKHFPGQGGALGESHKGAVNVDSDIDMLRKVEFVPFKAGIKAGADMILVSHISLGRVTGSTEPSTMSELVMTDILRTELSFEGVIITDAMDMQAITGEYSSKEAAVRAVAAGADMILMPESFTDAFEGILEAVEKGEITEERIDESARRILTLKIKRGIIRSNTFPDY